MAETGPAGSARDPFENLISIVAGPIAAVIRSFDQLRRGSDELLKGLENFNRTMQNLNATAERVNSLLNEFEEPVRTILPQVMRTVTLAEDLANRVSGPVDQVVPGLTRLATTLNSPVLTSLPTDLARFVDAINELMRRLSPLGQLAESATGLFGLRIPGVPRPVAPAAEPEPIPEPPAPPLPTKSAPARKAPKKKPAAKGSTARTSTSKNKQPAKRSQSPR
jgi:ABC-type transporter Mla subunit MlaD